MKFTKTNLLNFWNDYINKKPDESNEEAYFNFIDNVALDLVNTFDLPDFAGNPVDIVFNLLNNNIDYINTEYESPEESPQISFTGLHIIDESDADKEWRKTHEVLGNYKQILSTLQALPSTEITNLIQNLQLSAAEFPVGPGKICSPKKYLANTPKSLTDKIPSNILICEVKIKSSTNANYRAYGFILNNTLYILSVYTKTSGQENADKDFDTFIKKLINYIKVHKLSESLLYSILEESNMKNKTVFEELDEINEIQRLEDYCRGREDAYNNKLIEENANSSYLAGYTAVKNEEKDIKFRNWLHEHEVEVKEHIRKTLNSAKNN